MPENADWNPLTDPVTRRLLLERAKGAGAQGGDFGVFSIGIIPEGHKGFYRPTEEERKAGARFVAEARVRSAQIKGEITQELYGEMLKKFAEKQSQATE